MYQDKESLVGFVFIENIGIVEGYLTKTEITIKDVYISMQESIERWEGGLKATSGSISPYKLFVYPISFIWDDQGDYSFENPQEHEI